MKIIITLIVTIILCGCAGTHFTFEKANTVKVGMTESEVKKIMGKPYMVTSDEKSMRWVYSYADLGGARAVSFEFGTNGNVISVPRLSPFLNEPTNAPLKSPKGSTH